MTKIIKLQQKDNELEKLKESICNFVSNSYDFTHTYLDTILPRIESYIESENFASDLYSLIREKLDANDINIVYLTDEHQMIGSTFIHLHIPFNKRIVEPCELTEDVLGAKLEPCIRGANNFKEVTNELGNLDIEIRNMTMVEHRDYEMIYSFEIAFRGKMADYIMSVYNHFDLHAFDRHVEEDKNK